MITYQSVSIKSDFCDNSFAKHSFPGPGIQVLAFKELSETVSWRPIKDFFVEDLNKISEVPNQGTKALPGHSDRDVF